MGTTERTEAQILIIGGGAAGLSAAGALKKFGLSAIVLERDSAIGGTWARRYDRLRLHTIRQLSGLAHLPIPRRYPRYLSRDQFVHYLRGYAKRQGLQVVTDCEVKHIRLMPGGITGAEPGAERGRHISEASQAAIGVSSAPNARWQVETGCGIWQSSVVVVATGEYSVPHLPAWPGLETFDGKLIHSSEYRNGREWAGKRALVIGVGNSGAEISTDLAESGAAFVAVSIRTPPFLTKRDTLGVPVQLIGFALGMLPPGIADRLADRVRRAAFGDLQRYGIAAPGHSPYREQRVPLIDVGFADAVRRGSVAVRPDVQCFTSQGVRYSDGREEAFDLVIAATGFTSGLNRLLPPEIAAKALDGDCHLRYPSGEPTPWPGLYFIGFIHSLHGHLFEANRASRRLTKHIKRYLGHPAR